MDLSIQHKNFKVNRKPIAANHKDIKFTWGQATALRLALASLVVASLVAKYYLMYGS